KLATLTAQCSAHESQNRRLKDRVTLLSFIARTGAGDQVLEGLDLSGMDLSDLKLEGAHFRNVDLRKADLRGAVLKDGQLDQVDLSEADLRGADLRVSAARDVAAKGAIFDEHTRFDEKVLDLEALGAEKREEMDGL
ncbi:pentapeptide repeat-containing protein, partial [Planctomycetota bacterium]